MTDGPGISRLLMTADAVGGVWTYALDLARAMGSKGIGIAMATMGRRPDRAQRSAARRVPNLELFESTFKLEWMDDPWADVRLAGDWLLELSARVRPDIVHLNGYVHAALPWPAPTIVVGHSCVMSWWEAVKRERAPASWDRYREEVQRGLAAANLVVCPTRAMLSALELQYDGAITRARVIPNGRNRALFHRGKKDRFILTVGRLWDDAKNLQAIERAAPQLRWPVFVAGEEEHPGGHCRQFAGLRRLGRLDPATLARYYARAGIYALPARYEPFGLSVLEAALSGCALVLGDIPSLRESWADAALFVDPEDSLALCATINRVIEDSGLRKNLGAAARLRAQSFTRERMAEEYLSAYRAVAGREALCAS